MENVNVLMATFNGEKFICDQIESILNQSGVNVKLFISDDGSTDQTITFVKNYIKRGFNINLMYNKDGNGLPAINFLNIIKNIETSEKDYYAFADQDDLWHHEKLISGIEMIKKNEAELYCSNLLIWDGQETSGLIKRNNPQTSFDFLFESASAGCTYIFTHKLFFVIKENLSNLNKNWDNMSHDWIVYFFSRINNFKVFIDGRAFILYRQHQNNVFGSPSLRNLKPLKRKLAMVSSNWYSKHLGNYLVFLEFNSYEWKMVSTLLSGRFKEKLHIVLKSGFRFSRKPLKSVFISFLILTGKF